MNHILENEALTVQIKEAGAEVSSVRQKENGHEYIWQANPEVWPRHAPILFPIVGRLKDDRYRSGGKTFQMRQHGFARERSFNVLEQTRNRLTFGLTADADSMDQYPYNFVLDVAYTLQDNALLVEYTVSNKDQQTMPFSIGAHPAFATPSVVDQQMQEYWLEFEQPETLDRHLIIDGLRSGETKRLLENEQTLPLHPKLFEQDAIVFKNVQSGKVSLVSRSSGKKLVEMEITGFPYLGIWQKVGADFICIEPWYGLADEHDFDGELTDKEGILLLEPEKSFHCSYTIRFL